MGSDHNKSQLLDSLKIKLEVINCIVRQAKDDADVLIADTAIYIASTGQKVVFVGQDVDLLAILVAKTDSSCSDITFMKPAQGKVPTR